MYSRCKILIEDLILFKFLKKLKFDDRMIGFFSKILIFILVSWLNLFGINDSSVKLSRDIMLNATARIFNVQNDVLSLVILVDDQSLKEDGFVYPPELFYYAEIIDRLHTLGAASVFIDMIFRDVRPGLQEFADVLKDAKKTMPVFLASTVGEGRRNDCQEQVLSELTEAAAGFAAVFSQDSGFERYALDRAPCVSQESTPAQNLSESRAVSAALLMYRDWCRQNGRSCPTAPGLLNDRPVSLEPMVLRWRDAPVDPLSPEACQAPANGLLRAIGQMFLRLYDRAFPEFSDDSGQNAVSIQCIPLRVLQSAALTALPEQKLRKLVEGRPVFLGFALAGANDIITSPTVGTVPGVTFHATAFENLVAYGDRYFRQPPKISGGIGADTLIEATMLALALALQGKIASLSAGLGGSNHALRFAAHLAVFLATLVILLIVLFALSVAVFLTFRWEPANWIAVLALSFVFTEAQRDRLFGDFKKLLRISTR